MRQLLSYAGFRCVEDASNFDVNVIAVDSSMGYILEVDLEYPQHLHDEHIDLPFYLTCDKPPGKREDKLFATLYAKKRYASIEICSNARVTIFTSQRYIAYYNSLNLHGKYLNSTQFKTRTRNEFEKNLYKLMNNAVFGKTMENIRNHIDVKLLTKWKRRYDAEIMIAKSNFYSHSIFS